MIVWWVWNERPGSRGAYMSAPGKIVLVAKPWRGGLAKYLASALAEQFHDNVLCLYTYPTTAREKISYRLDRRSWRLRLVDKIQSIDADVVIFVNLLPEFALLPRRPEYVLWMTDSPVPALDFLAPYSRVYLSDPGYAESVRQVVGDARFSGVLPFACQPDIHKPVAQGRDSKGFCFIANRDAKRDQVLNYLFTHGHQVHVYGNYFLRHPLYWRYPAWFGPSIDNSRMGQIYARHLASLNIHADIVRGGTNMRTFECAAYGVPQLVEYRPGIEEYFDLEKELYVYHDESELVDMMKHIQASPGEARKRAARARDRALGEHTYQRRIERLMLAL